MNFTKFVSAAIAAGTLFGMFLAFTGAEKWPISPFGRLLNE